MRCFAVKSFGGPAAHFGPCIVVLAASGCEMRIAAQGLGRVHILLGEISGIGGKHFGRPPAILDHLYELGHQVLGI